MDVLISHCIFSYLDLFICPDRKHRVSASGTDFYSLAWPSSCQVPKLHLPWGGVVGSSCAVHGQGVHHTPATPGFRVLELIGAAGTATPPPTQTERKLLLWGVNQCSLWRQEDLLASVSF